jgi:hypothetical protein
MGGPSLALWDVRRKKGSTNLSGRNGASLFGRLPRLARCNDFKSVSKARLPDEVGQSVNCQAEEQRENQDDDSATLPSSATALPTSALCRVPPNRRRA